MKIENYEKIVKNIIIPLSNEILTSENNKLYNLVKLTKEYDENLFEKINKCISRATHYLVSTHQIDRYKTSASVMCAIIQYNPFTVYKNGYNFENLVFANELLGIYTAISLLECYRPGLHIIFPPTNYTSDNIDPYIKTLCMSIYTNKNNRNIEHDILTYANIFSFLELFSINNKSS